MNSTKFAVTHCTTKKTTSPPTSPSMKIAAGSACNAVKRVSRLNLAELFTTTAHSRTSSGSSSGSDAPQVLKFRSDLNMTIQKIQLEADRRASLEKFIANHQGHLKHDSTEHEVIAAKMLVTEAIHFQKRNHSAKLEHTLRADIPVTQLRPGCCKSTMKLLLSDVEAIMNNPRHANGYDAAKNSLGRVPLWLLPEEKGSLI